MQAMLRGVGTGPAGLAADGPKFRLLKRLIHPKGVCAGDCLCSLSHRHMSGSTNRVGATGRLIISGLLLKASPSINMVGDVYGAVNPIIR